MKYSEIKEICLKLEKECCYFCHPKSDFVKVLGQDTVDDLLKRGWIKDSPKLEAYWIDYHERCYEFGTLFRKMFNFIVNRKWMWFKIYVLQLWRVQLIWQKFRIACGHHYDWQDYEGVTDY